MKLIMLTLEGTVLGESVDLDFIGRNCLDECFAAGMKHLRSFYKTPQSLGILSKQFGRGLICPGSGIIVKWA